MRYLTHPVYVEDTRLNTQLCSGTYGRVHRPHLIPVMMVITPLALPNKIGFSLPFLYKPITRGGGGGSCSAFTCRSVSSLTSFTWDDVVQASQPDYAPNDSSDLSGFFEKIKYCNRGSSVQSELSFPLCFGQLTIFFTV